MIRIITICLLFSQIICDDDSFSLSEILEMEESFQNSLEFMKKEVTDKQGILFIGTAKAGKSTLLNYLIGKKLKAIRPNIFDVLKITQVNEFDNGPEIGMETTSSTAIPTKWKSEKFPNYILWDCPGFNDNRGSVQDINNGMFIYQLIKNIDKLKFTLVVNAEDFLEDKINSFLNVLTHLKTLFGDNFEDVYNSISVIYTHVPFSFNELVVDNEYISKQMRKNVVSEIRISMDESSRKFVNFTTFNEDNIAFFRKPKREGILSSCVYDNIIPAISSTRQINNDLLQDVKPSISSQSSKYIMITYTNLKDMQTFVYLEELISKFVKKFEDASKQKIREKDIPGILSLTNPFRGHKNQILSKRSSNNYAIDNIEYLRTLQDDIKKFIDSTQLIKKIKAISFIEIVLKTKDKILFFIKKIIDHFYMEIERLIMQNDSSVVKYFINDRAFSL